MNMRVKNKKKGKSTPKDGGRGDGDEGNSLASALKPDRFNPEDFLSSNEKISLLSLDLLKQLYDLTKSSENKSSLEDPLGLQTESLKTPISKFAKKKRKGKRGNVVSKAEAPVPSLITENFDEDQIWEEVELQNGLMYDNLVTSVSKLLAYQEKPMEPSDSDEDTASSEEEDDQEVVEGEDLPENKNSQLDDEEDSDFFESDEKYRKKASKQVKDGKKYKKSVVDDQFFSLAQMTEHIEQVEADMERAEAKRTGQLKDNSEDESSEEEDSIDLFEDVPSEEEKEETKEAQYFYQDFFDPPIEKEEEDPVEGDNNQVLSKEEEDDDEEEEGNPNLVKIGDRKKSVKFNLEEEEDEEEEDDQDEDDDDSLDEEEKDKSSQNKELGKKINETLSSFEKRKKKIEESIKEIEDEALKPKSWQLLGEASGETRPENALLEEHLIYEHMIRPAPEITVETTLKLEDVIKQRIKDGAWDDVQRKVRPIEDPREYKKRLVLDAEKSKASLAEIYEQEYLDKKKAEDGEAEEKEPEEHVQIRKEMQSLFQKLDALSHFHFTPKAPKADVKIVSNMPSISIEETAGVSVSDANMLAPQEIQDHAKGAIKGKEERSVTDRKRERRKKKKKQHLKRLQQEEKAAMKGLGLRNIKLAEGIVKSQKKKQAEGDGSGFSYSTTNQNSKELKSSKAFFSKLQESASSHIDKVAKRKKAMADGERNNLSAKKFKL